MKHLKEMYINRRWSSAKTLHFLTFLDYRESVEFRTLLTSPLVACSLTICGELKPNKIRPTSYEDIGDRRCKQMHISRAGKLKKLIDNARSMLCHARSRGRHIE